MRQTPVDDYLEEISTELPEELYGNLSDAIYETVCKFDEEVAQLKAENAKLREQIHWLKQGDILHVLTDQEYIDQCERERLMQVSIDALDKENAKLRELARKVLQFERAGCDGCPYASTCDADCLYDPDCPMREDIERDMRELGLEVTS